MSNKYIVISGRITSNMIDVFIRDVLERIDEGDHLHLCLMSHGGDVPLALGLSAFLKSLPCTLTSYNMSYIDSAAVLLFASAQQRICTPHGVFRLHPVTSLIESAVDIPRLGKLHDMLKEDTLRVCRYLESCTGQRADDWQRLMESEISLDGKQAAECGLVTAMGTLPQFDTKATIFIH